MLRCGKGEFHLFGGSRFQIFEGLFGFLNQIAAFQNRFRTDF